MALWRRRTKGSVLRICVSEEVTRRVDQRSMDQRVEFQVGKREEAVKAVRLNVGGGV